MNYALSELEARHHRKKLAIMERMEQLELAFRPGEGFLEQKRVL